MVLFSDLLSHFILMQNLRLRRMTLIIPGRQVKEAEEDDDTSLVYGKFRFQQVGKC
jgi:hypothetical protein